MKVAVHDGSQKAHSLVSTTSEQQQVLFERTRLQHKMTASAIGSEVDCVSGLEMVRIIQPRPPAMPKATFQQPFADTDLRATNWQGRTGLLYYNYK